MGIKARYLNDKNGKFYPQAHADATYDRNGNRVGDILAQLMDDVGNLKYIPISISSFTNDVSNAENGMVITDVTLKWTTNKTPTLLTLDGEQISVTSNSIALSGLNIKTTSKWTLKATDERGNSAIKNTYITFMNGIFYGASSEPDEYDSDFILGLTNKVLSNSKYSPISVDAGIGEYIYYCVPSSYGVSNFNVGGFDGGFKKIATIDFTNTHDYTVGYDIWKSDNQNLGNTTVKVS